MDTKAKYQHLKSRLEKKHKIIKERLVSKHKDALSWVSNNTKQLAAGTVGSLLLLSPPNMKFLDSTNAQVQEQFLDLPENMFLITNLSPLIPEDVDLMDSEKEQEIAAILSDVYGFNVKPDINGLRLQHTYGYIGAEQHLMRYPGDTMESHFESSDQANKYYSSGMAPGRGAWGYFADSRNALSQKEIDREKYYIAVQTFLAVDYGTRLSEYRDFFKYRKMLVVNPSNGHAIVVVIGDSGPAVWTKKHLGGSPEVMKHLERVDGRQKGTVLYFFIDDPEGIVPLGPIEPVNKELANSQ